MTYDLEVILKYCGRSSHDLLVLWVVLAALGAVVGGLVPLLEHVFAVLAHTWDFCGRSWAALGACVGGLGRSRGLCCLPLLPRRPRNNSAPERFTLPSRTLRKL